MVTVLSRAFARQFAEPFGLVLLEPPIKSAELPVTMVWPASRKNDRLLAWLRGVFKEVAGKLVDEGEDRTT
jgi:DNA-binding transcriptional LysR family regulator